jgi:hypothetical protein
LDIFKWQFDTEIGNQQGGRLSGGGSSAPPTKRWLLLLLSVLKPRVISP